VPVMVAHILCALDDVRHRPAAEERTDLIVEALQGMAGVEGPGGSGRKPESDPIAIEISG
jgi:hypothetical protein